MNSPSLPERILQLRRRLGLTQEQFAGEIGVTQPTLSRWERGLVEPTLADLFELSTLDNEGTVKDWTGWDWPKKKPFFFDSALVTGVLRYDDWREDAEWRKKERYTFDFPEIRQIRAPKKTAYIVEDEHANNRFPKGSHVIVVGVHGPPQPGEHLVLWRVRGIRGEGPILSEIACWKCQVYKGQTVLELDSNDPKFRVAIPFDFEEWVPLEPTDEDDAQGWGYVGHVVAAFTPILDPLNRGLPSRATATPDISGRREVVEFPDYIWEEDLIAPE